MNRLFVIIPARAGSVGVPDKNIAPVGGLPLLVRAYRVARSLPFDKQNVVSTDSARYVQLLGDEGHEDTALRPPELSGSGSLVIDTVLYELARVAADDSDLVLLLEPSFVGRRRENVIRAVQHVVAGAADSCFGVYPVPPAFHHAKQYVRDGDFARPIGTQANVNRQQLQGAYVRSGEFYLSRVHLVRAERSLFGGRLWMLETSTPFVNIDQPEDMARAHRVAEEHAD